MRVLLVNTSEKTGGAAVAARRLMDALNNNGVKAKMLVREKETDALTVSALPSSWRLRWHFLWERLCIYVKMHFRKEHLFEADIANAGSDITSLREFQEADVIHLHWINQGMLSIGSIRKILESGKPVVWTMHDMWPATAICHYARDCKRFQTACSHCPLLPGGGADNDLSARVWQRKQRVWTQGNISFVACSRWLERQARESELLRGKFVTNVPNPINVGVFCRKDKAEARRRLGLPVGKRVILFASQRVTDQRKGIRYLVEALSRMVSDYPEMKDNTVVAVLGGHAEEVVGQLALPAFPLGYVSDEKTIVDVYNAADTFVLPSLEDNLPNTIMEAMACGVPCVGFNTGGIPEMIDHLKTGYVAACKDAADLARGIRLVLDETDADEISRQCVSKVMTAYSYQRVALKYIDVYNQALAVKDETV